MFKRTYLVVIVLVGLAVISGCATTRNYQGDIDSLNARISSLQNEVSAKDQEISKMQGQLGEQQNALSQAETDKRLLNEKLDTTLKQLEEKSRKVEAAPVKKAEESDLK